MAVIRIPERIWARVCAHLLAQRGEHFAFLQARWCMSGGKPVLMVRDVIIVPDERVTFSRTGWELDSEAILDVINAAVRSGDALIEIHNHGGSRPRFSPTDRDGLREFPAYVLDSLPGRPYGATVWGDATVYGEYFLPDGRSGPIDSIAVVGRQLRQIVSRDDDDVVLDSTFDRQVPWFTAHGKRQLGRLKVAIVGAGGTGSQMAQNLVYLGIRDFVLIDHDRADQRNMNRLVTATAADVETPKGILARRLIKSVAPHARTVVIDDRLQSVAALDAIKGVDVVLGCVDNDGARLILNELSVAYGIPYFDLAVGIDAEGGNVSSAGGRVAVVLPGGPCLQCMGEIDVDEARYFLNSNEEQARAREHGDVRGFDVPSPSVVSVNALIAAVAANELAIFISGLRPVNVYTEFDLLGVGRPVKSQWTMPSRWSSDPGCVQCMLAGVGDAARLERYAGA